jgi:hypothetical protein
MKKIFVLAIALVVIGMSAAHAQTRTAASAAELGAVLAGLPAKQQS